MRYTVAVREVHISYRDVEASTFEEAVEKSTFGDFDNEYTEYSYTPDTTRIDIHDTETGVMLVEDYQG
tara:strand:- start:846 stop:1049 length:204 start_codon:yes stop_codon:yes gene_type:complete